MGTTVRNPALAATLERLAKAGADSFYQGLAAAALAAEVAADTPRPRPLNAGDLAAYEADPDTFVVPNAGEVLYRLR